MKKNYHLSLSITFIFFSFILAAQNPYLIFLEGPCCAGKSSLFRELENQNPSWSFISDDEEYYTYELNSWKDEFPKEVALIENIVKPKAIFHAVIRQEFQFRCDILDKEKQQAIDAAQKVQCQIFHAISWEKKQAMVKKHIQEIVANNLSTSETIVIDAWLLSSEEIEAYRNAYNVTRVRLYCPLKVHYQRLQKRNKNAQESSIWEQRYPHQIIRGYFDPLCKAHANTIVDTLNKEELTTIFNHIKTDIANPDIPTARLTVDQLEEIMHKQLSRLDLHQQESVNVTFNCPVDLCIYCDEHSPRECAELVMNFVNG